MASSLSPISSNGTRQLNLSVEELRLSPWNQMLTNGALDPNRVTVSDSAGSSTRIEDSDQEGYFSDEEHPTTSGEKKCESQDAPELNLREYQKELAENALRGDNTIICAPTGSGKTRVATHIILEHLKKSTGDRKVAFFAKTVPLAVQQYKVLCKYLPSYEITLITGQSEQPMSLHMLLEYNDIIVMTPQILENHLQKNYLPHLGVFSMLVFDECHHTLKKDPYKLLMMSYLKTKDTICKANVKGKPINIRLPQILGLTATIGIDKAPDLKTAIQNIMMVCASLDVANLSTVRRNIDELNATVPVPVDKFKRLTERDSDESVAQIHKLMESLENQLKHLAEELTENGFVVPKIEDMPIDRKSQVYEQWAIELKTHFMEVGIPDPDRETNIPVRLSIILLEYLLSYRVALESYDLVELKDVIEFLERCFQEFSHEESTVGETRFFTFFQELKRIVLTRHGEENPNLRIMTETLLEYLVGKGEVSRGIIFVRTRALAVALSNWLQRCEIEAIKNLNARKFTGSNVTEEKGGTTQAQQEDILQRFKSGEVRLLVATSVAEEGLDITQCNLVIKYNHVGTEVSTVQTRGRCRQFGGVSVLLAMNRILQRERMNHFREKLMWEAIKEIVEMDPKEFKERIEGYQVALIYEAYLAELLQRSRLEELEKIPFRMVCVWCRKVAVEGINVRKIECHYVSIDRQMLDHILVIPDKKPKQIDNCLLIGKVLCRGEPEPGSICKKKLGRVMKYEQIPYVTLNIKCFAFDFQGNVAVFKKWIKTGLAIENLNFDDTVGYIKDTKVLARPKPVMDKEDSSDESSCESDDDDTTPKRF